MIESSLQSAGRCATCLSYENKKEAQLVVL